MKSFQSELNVSYILQTKQDKLPAYNPVINKNVLSFPLMSKIYNDTVWYRLRYFTRYFYPVSFKSELNDAILRQKKSIWSMRCQKGQAKGNHLAMWLNLSLGVCVCLHGHKKAWVMRHQYFFFCLCSFFVLGLVDLLRI